MSKPQHGIRPNSRPTRRLRPSMGIESLEGRGLLSGFAHQVPAANIQAGDVLVTFRPRATPPRERAILDFSGGTVVAHPTTNSYLVAPGAGQSLAALVHWFQSRTAVLSARNVPASAPSIPPNPNPPTATSDNSLLLSFQPGISAARELDDLAAVGGTVVETVTDGPSLVVLPAGTTVAAAAGVLSANPDVRYAVPNVPITPDTVRTGPAPAYDATNTNSLLLAYRPGVSAAQQAADLSAVGGIVDEVFFDGGEGIFFKAGEDPEAAQATLNQNPDIAYVSLNSPVSIPIGKGPSYGFPDKFTNLRVKDEPNPVGTRTGRVDRVHPARDFRYRSLRAQ